MTNMMIAFNQIDNNNKTGFYMQNTGIFYTQKYTPNSLYKSKRKWNT